jgi:hypothetical protein
MLKMHEEFSLYRYSILYNGAMVMMMTKFTQRTVKMFEIFGCSTFGVVQL